MDKNKIELALTGDQAIDLMAAALAGVPHAALAYSFKLDEAEVQALIAACQEQGLSTWCQAQQARNDVPAKSPAPAPKVNCTLVPDFILAAVQEVRAGMSLSAAAQLFHVAVSTLSSQLLALQNLGWEAWCSQLQRTKPNLKEVMNFRRPANKRTSAATNRALLSPQRRIALVALYWSHQLTVKELTTRSQLSHNHIWRLATKIPQPSLMAWLLQERECAAQNPLTKEQKQFERAHPLPAVELTTIPKFIEEAVLAVQRDGMSVAQVARALACTQKQIKAWLTAAQEQGMEAWARSLQPQRRPNTPHRSPKHSGAFRIHIMAALLSGKWGRREVLELFGGALSTVVGLRKQVQAQGLYAWCAKMRRFDQESPYAQALRTADLKRKWPELDFNHIIEFRREALRVIKEQGVSPQQAAEVLGLELKQVEAWLKRPEAALVVTEPITPELSALLKRYAHSNYSGKRRIELLGAALQGNKQVPYQLGTRLKAKAQEMGLYAWCEEQRKVDQYSARAQSLLREELEQAPVNVDLDSIPAFELAAVTAVISQGLLVSHVASVLGLKLGKLRIKYGKVRKQGYAQWLRQFSAEVRNLVGVKVDGKA